MANFNLAIETVLKNEGGYVNNPSDPGGETKYGISKRAYPDLDIASLTVSQACDVYLRDFWKFSGIENQQVATKIFDSYVNMEHAAIRLAQIVTGVPEDGVYGPMTENAINRMDPSVFLTNFRNALVLHYQQIVASNPSQAQFLNGWLNRARQ